MLTVAIVATLAGGGSAAATWGNDPTAAGSNEIAAETAITPVMELPNGCAGDDWSFEGSID